METGEVFTADLGHETPRQVLVLSDASFHRRSSRVVVAPEFRGPDTALLLPWRVPAGEVVFAVDHVRSMEAERLLDSLGRAPYWAVVAARRALLAITG